MRSLKRKISVKLLVIVILSFLLIISSVYSQQSVPAPTISSICTGENPKVTIKWSDAGMGSQGYIVDIDDDNNWNNGFWNKGIIPSGTTTTTAPDGFNTYYVPNGPVTPSQLTLTKGSNYWTRIFYQATDEHSPTTAFIALIEGAVVSVVAAPPPPPPPAGGVGAGAGSEPKIA